MALTYKSVVNSVSKGIEEFCKAKGIDQLYIECSKKLVSHCVSTVVGWGYDLENPVIRDRFSAAILLTTKYEIEKNHSDFGLTEESVKDAGYNEGSLSESFGVGNTTISKFVKDLYPCIEKLPESKLTKNWVFKD